MSLSRLCNKNFLAPVGYVILQILLLIGFSLTCPSIVDPDDNLVYMIFFWLSVFITFVMYFITHFKDPGYIPHNNHSFRDQEENNFSKPKSSTRNESELKFKAMDSRNQSVQENLPYETKIEMKEKLTNINRVQLRRLKFSEAITNSTSYLNTNMYTGKLSTQDKSTPIAANNQTQELGEKEEREEEINKPDTIVPFKNPTRGSQNVVCEPSIDEKDEGEESSSEEYDGKVDFNAKSKDAIDGLEGEMEVKDASPQKNNSYSIPAQKVIIDNTSNFTKNYQTIPSVIVDHCPEKGNDLGMDETQIAKKKTNSYTKIHQDKTADVSCNVPLQTGDEDKSKEFRVDDMNSKLEKHPTRNLEDGLAPRNSKYSSKPSVKLGSPFESPLSQKKLDLSNLRAPSDDTLSERKQGPSKDVSRSQNQMNGNILKDCEKDNLKEKQIELSSKTEMKIQLDDKDNHEEKTSKQAKTDTLDAFYVEKRYCTVCNLEQPFRSKHCKECDRCIARYDHHCPWLGNCVGEKNHCFFYWFLVFQVTEIILGAIQMYKCVFDEEYEGNLPWKIIILVIGTFFLLMAGSLVMCHSYLAIRNLTTWEALSWNKITYLSDWPKAWGSPFSKGVFKNLKYFCFKRKNTLTQWEMPRYRKPLNQQRPDNL